MKPFKDHLTMHACLKSLRNNYHSKSSLENFLHQYLPKLLVYV